MSLADILQIVAIFGAVIVFATGLWQYIEAQQWKRAEWVAAVVKEFDASASVRNAKLMLDWNARSIELFPDHETPSKRQVRVTGELVWSALRDHRTVAAFSSAEARIRDIFDEFFDHLERISFHIAAGLVTAKDFKPYLQYWIDLMGRTAVRPDIVPALWGYIKRYDFHGVEMLLTAFGYQIVEGDLDKKMADPNPEREAEKSAAE